MPSGVYLHLHSKKYDFKGCYAGSAPPQLKVDETEWATAYAQSGGASDPLTVELSTMTGGMVSGPIKESWTFAKGDLAGVVYYNTYGSKLVPGQMGQNGAVMKIAPAPRLRRRSSIRWAAPARSGPASLATPCRPTARRSPRSSTPIRAPIR